MRVSIANEFIYAHPIPEDVVSVLEHYWECKNDAPFDTSGMFILPKNASNDKHISRLLQGMELFKEYQSFDHHMKPRPKGSPSNKVAIQVWYDPPDSERAVQIKKDWHAINDVTKAVYFGPAPEEGIPRSG
jgi:hypothetical protein